MEHRSEDSEDVRREPGDGGHASTGPRRRGAWLLLVVMIFVGAGIGAFCTQWLLWQLKGTPQPPQDRSQVSRQAQSPPPVPAYQRSDALPRKTETPPSEVPAPVPLIASASLPVPEDAPPPESAADLTEEAEQVADRLVESFSDDPNALEMMGRVQFYLGNSGEAKAAWQRCLELDPAYAYAYFGLGGMARKEGDYEEAVDLLRKGLALAPGGYRPVFQLADAFIKLGRLDESIQVLRQHVAADPQAAWSYYLLGQAYLQSRQYEEAAGAYETAIRIHADQTGARSGPAGYGRQAGTQQLREYMAELDRLRNTALYGLATAYARLGDEEKSGRYMEQFKKARAVEKEAHLDPQNRYDDLQTMCGDLAVIFTLAARVYSANGDLPAAEKLWRRAATLDPVNTECRAQLVSLYQRANRLDEALRLSAQLAEIDPQNAAWHLNLGSIHAGADRFAEAEEAFNKAVEAAPERPWGYRELARLYLAKNRKLPEARRLAREAVRLEPVAQNYVLLSEACDRNGDTAGARAAIRRAVELDPDNADYRRIRQRLEARN